MLDFSNFPSVCRTCFELTLDCNISAFARLDYCKLRLTYEDLLNELSFIPPQEYKNDLPSFLCNACAQRIEQFSNFRRQTEHILKFSIALLALKQRNDSQPLIDMLKSDKSDQLQRVLRRLNVIDNEVLTIDTLIENVRNGHKTETIEEEVHLEEVTVDVDQNQDMNSENEYSIIETAEQKSEPEEDEEPFKKKRRKQSRKTICREGQKFKSCPLEGCKEEYLVGNRAAYLHHEKNFHRYGCKVCGRVLASRTSFHNHVLLHDGEKAKVKCQFCERTFTTRGSMMVHIREVHNDTGIHFNCQYCAKGFMEQKNLYSHLHEHNVCKICDETFADLPGWISHTRKQHPETLFTCDQCDHTSLSQALLDRHKRMKHSENSVEQKPVRFTIFAINRVTFHQCPLCNLQFTSEEFLLQHNTQVHNQTQEDKQVRSTAKRRSREEREKFALRYSCDDCGKMYRFKNSLWSHRHKEHSVEQKTVICDTCGHHFKHHSYLSAHIANKHATEFPFRCETCPKAYSQAYLLKEHMKSHDTEKRHKCPHCNYRAKQSHLLKDHVIRMHSTERLAKCSDCDRAFINNGDLKKHMAVHSANMRFQCDECDQVFRRKMDLGRHTARVHVAKVTKKRKLSDKVSNINKSAQDSDQTTQTVKKINVMKPRNNEGVESSN
ncbi:zinc finger protein 808 [Aedes aegypti]|uniref:Uncharacterized protein n=1 Tax=Aedes aegypti TaxID=7159 RepID=A0A6I8T5P8_AEDAE|nr:zinc finger protein 808 [Aedes aegypti]